MDKPIWLDEAVKMHYDDGLQYSEIVQRFRKYFPADMHDSSINRHIRDAVRRSDRGKAERKSAQGGQTIQQSCRKTQKDTGETVFEEIIELLAGE